MPATPGTCTDRENSSLIPELDPIMILGSEAIMYIENKRNVYIPLIIKNEYFADTKRHNSYTMFH